MMPWGRQRMAEAEYEKALTEYNSPKAKNQKVLWHANAALNLNPKFSEALELKQKVSGKEMAAVDNSTVRGLVRRLILNDRVGSAAPAPTPGRTDATPAVPPVPQASNQTGTGDQKTESAKTEWSEEIPLDEVKPENTPATTPEPAPAPGTPELTPEPTPTPGAGASATDSSGVKWPTPDNVVNK
jgi:hypothetical protein